MDAEDFEGTLVLEKLAEIDGLDIFFEMIDNDDFKSAAALMRTAKIDEPTIAIVVEKMKAADGEH